MRFLFTDRVNLLDDIRLCEAEEIVVSLELLRVVFEPLPAKLRLIQLVLLDHRSHRAIENMNSLRPCISQVRLQVRTDMPGTYSTFGGLMKLP